MYAEHFTGTEILTPALVTTRGGRVRRGGRIHFPDLLAWVQRVDIDRCRLREPQQGVALRPAHIRETKHMQDGWHDRRVTVLGGRRRDDFEPQAALPTFELALLLASHEKPSAPTVEKLGTRVTVLGV